MIFGCNDARHSGVCVSREVASLHPLFFGTITSDPARVGLIPRSKSESSPPAGAPLR